MMEEGGEETKTKKKKEYRYVSETESGREWRMKTNRSFMRTGCLLIRACDEDNRAMTVVTGIQFNQSQHAVSHNTDALLTESGCPITLTPHSHVRLTYNTN